MLLYKPQNIIDDIPIYAPDISDSNKDYSSLGLDKLHAAESNYFWFQSRKKWIVDVFFKFINKDNTVLEIGAGTGNVSLALKDHGYNISVAEMHLNGLRYAKKYGIENCYQIDLFDPPFKEEFNTIGMFDVLEHLDDDALALEKINTILTIKGRLVLTVPAHQWLWNKDDEIAGHKRRYTTKQLSEVVKNSGFKILHCRYFFVLITPLLLLRRLPFINKQDTIDDVDFKINPIINKLLLWVTMFEARFTQFLPNYFGGSLILVAEKEDNQI